MTLKVVSNAPPLIYAAKIGFLPHLKKLYGRVLIPPAVHEEAVERGVEMRAADALVIEKAVKEGWIMVLELSDHLMAEALTKVPDISSGEAQCVVLAKDVGSDLLIIDERGGTLVARAWGLKTVGPLGVIIEAMVEGVITFRELKTYFEALINTEFRLRHADYVKAMALAEEARRKLLRETIPEATEKENIQ